MPTIDLVYGHQEWTTATHLERALASLDSGDTGLTKGRSPLVWVESGVPWLPAVSDFDDRVTAAWIIDTHRGMGWRRRLAQAFDVAFVAQRNAVAPLRAAGVPAEWLPLAAPGDFVVPAPPPSERPHDVAFVGQMLPGTLRADVLDALGARFSVAPCPGYLDPRAMMALYATARVVINLPLADDLNMRTFEAAAAGALLVTGPQDGLDHVLPADGYVEVTERSVDAWVRGVRQALDAPDLDDRAAAAQAAVLGGHTYRHRAVELTERLSDPSCRRPIDDEARRRALAAGYARWGDTAAAASLPRSTIGRVRAGVEATTWRTASGVVQARRGFSARRAPAAPARSR